MFCLEATQQNTSGLQFKEEAFRFSFCEKIKGIVSQNQKKKKKKVTENKTEFLVSCSKLQVSWGQVLNKYGACMAKATSHISDIY